MISLLNVPSIQSHCILSAEIKICLYSNMLVTWKLSLLPTSADSIYLDRDELFTVDLVLLHPELGIVPALIMLGLAVLLGFYFFHYFFLENTVQRWYRIAEEMRERTSMETALAK